MIPPSGMTEASVLEAIEEAVGFLVKKKSAFGYYDVDDLKQEARVFALELIAKGTYTPGRPLANYVFTHVRRRLLNLRRDRFWRSEPSCKPCSAGSPCGPDGSFCQPHESWLRRNRAKANLAQAADLTDYADFLARPGTAESSAEAAELKGLIDRELPLELRVDYLKMLDGESVPLEKREVVGNAVLRIMRKAGLEVG